MTRGNGLAERFLAGWRGRIANSKLPGGTRIVDIGCGVLPEFVSRTRYDDKYVIDPAYKIKSTSMNFLPQVNAVTLLAVIEHSTKEDGEKLIREAYDKLEPGGVLFLTTPASWTKGTLELLAKLNIVSQEEISEHKQYYNTVMLEELLSDFNRVETGTFMFGVNLWAKAIK